MPTDPLPARRRAALLDFAARVRAALGPRLLRLSLFGSVARGEAQPDSDLDVLVVVDTADLEIEDRVFDVAFAVGLLTDLYISPRVIDRATLEHPIWRETPFLKAVVRDGVPL